MRASRGIAVGGVLAALLAASCSSTDVASTSPSSTAPPNGAAGAPGGSAPAGTTAAPATTAAQGTFPGAQWDTVDPVAAGFDPSGLQAVADASASSGSNCTLVARDGKIVDEWYWNGTDPSSTQEVFSTTKSLTSTLVGIAQGDGDLKITDKASDYITEWKGTPSEDVTIRNLISNDSGRYQDAATDYVRMAVQEPDKTAFSIGLEQQHEIGSTWVYNNAAIQTLDEVLQKATGESPADFAKERIFTPIGMSESVVRTDPSGNTLTFMGLVTTCRDLARFGHLFLEKGNWDGTQIVPADFVAEATVPSQALNKSYGFLWWLNTKAGGAGAGQAMGEAEGDAGAGGQMAAGGPEDAFFALGMGGQILAVYPEQGVVAVRIVPINTPEGSTPFGPKDLTRVVTEALTSP